MARILNLPTTIARMNASYSWNGGLPAYHLDWMMNDFLMLGDLDQFFDIWLQDPPDSPTYSTRLVFTPSGKELAEHPRFIDVANHFGLMAVWNAKTM